MKRPCMRLPLSLGAGARQRLAKPSLRGKLAGMALGAVMLAACQPAAGANPAIKLSANHIPAELVSAPNVPGDPNNGRKLFTDSKFYPPSGCASCHTLLGVSSGIYPGAPNLTNVGLRPTIAVELQNSPAQMKAWIMDPPSQKQGARMPKLNVSDQEATDLVAFLYSIPYNPIQQ